MPSSRLSVDVAAPTIRSSISATQTVQQGYKTYPNINESDWWWWYIALDIPDALLSSGEILYQYVTLTDTSVSPNTYVTLGCSIQMDTPNSYTLQHYTLTNADQLDSASSEVIGKAYNGQAEELLDEAGDIKWKAGTTHVPTTAPVSTTAGNTNHACYFYEELPKIGRNPDDFGKSMTAKLGARIYPNPTATTFDSTPTGIASITKDNLAAPNYQAVVVVSAAPVVSAPVVVAPTGGLNGGVAGDASVITPATGTAGHGVSHPDIQVGQAPVPGGQSTLAMAFASLLLFFALFQ
jgi:hypothetical protein